MNPASPIPNSVRRTIKPVKDVAIDCSDAMVPHERTMMVT